MLLTLILKVLFLKAGFLFAPVNFKGGVFYGFAKNRGVFMVVFFRFPLYFHMY